MPLHDAYGPALRLLGAIFCLLRRADASVYRRLHAGPANRTNHFAPSWSLECDSRAEWLPSIRTMCWRSHGCPYRTLRLLSHSVYCRAGAVALLPRPCSICTHRLTVFRPDDYGPILNDAGLPSFTAFFLWVLQGLLREDAGVPRAQRLSVNTRWRTLGSYCLPCRAVVLLLLVLTDIALRHC